MRKIFTAQDFGAPSSIANTAGAMITALQACLVDGYGDQTPTSITRAGTTATMVLANAHGFTRTGVLNISGCDQADYNGEFRVTVVDSVTVTFTVANSPVTPATGTIVCRQDGAGWTMPFTDTNKAVFKQGAASNGLYLDVDDTNLVYAKVRGYETMTGVGVGIAPFPTVGQDATSNWIKGSSGTDWIAIADEHFIMLWSRAATSAFGDSGLWFFGDYRETFGINNFGTMLQSSPSTGTAAGSLGQLDDDSASISHQRYIARDYTELGASQQVVVIGNQSMCKGSIAASGNGSDYPDPLSGNVYMQELAILSNSLADNLLGHIDGAYTMLHALPLGGIGISYFGGSGDFLNDEFVYMPSYLFAAVVMRISD